MIREEIGAGEFDRAALLWNDYAAAIRQEIDRGTCTRDRVAEAGELLDWARRVVYCVRMRTQARVHSMQVASRYDTADVPRPSTLRASL